MNILSILCVFLVISSLTSCDDTASFLGRSMAPRQPSLPVLPSPSPSPFQSCDDLAIPIDSSNVFASLMSKRYTWIFAITMLASFVSSFAIGANDVANSFASAVASGLLTMRHVVMIASVTEFLGAVALGDNVSSTIRKDIVDIEEFDDRQDLLMFGMFVALMSSGLWDLLATFMKMPVSTTHSIVGGIIGMGIATNGIHGVNWSFSSGVARIVLGFVLSPLLSGIIAAVIFSITRLAVLERKRSYELAILATPLYAFCTTVLIMVFFVYKGSPRLGLDEYETWKQMVIIFPPAVFVAILSYFLFIPIMKHYEGKRVAEEERKQNEEMADPVEAAAAAPVEEEAAKEVSKVMAFLNRTVLYGINQKYAGAQTEKQEELHHYAKTYDENTENVFKWLQLFSCSTASFAHGANDVANAVAPLATVFAIWQDGGTSSTTAVPEWILAYGGAGIAIGLALLSWRLMANLGSNITKLTPSRGFSAEMGAIVAVLTYTGLELPVSTTHVITGATVAVGLCSGNYKAVNWKMFAYICLGWVISIPMAALVSGIIMSLCVNAPNTKYVDLYMDVNLTSGDTVPLECFNVTA